jgi:hypothetical protein
VAKITFENQPVKRFVNFFPFFYGMLAPTLKLLQYKIECYEKDLFVIDDRGGSMICTPASAQVRVNINIGSQPVWGPVGYDHVDYYYLPDIETYYYVPTRQFVYFNKWQMDIFNIIALPL